MSRDDGFLVMDLSTSIHDDPKFKRMARRHPELIAPAFLAYVATVAESWRHGELVPIEDAWPSLIPYDQAVVAALRRFELLDRKGRVAGETWDHWFGPAFTRREAARAAGREGNRRRWHGESPADRDAIAPRSGTDPRPSVPSVPTDPTVSPGDARDAGDGVEDRQRDPADDYWTITGTYPNDKARAWIDDLTEQYGASAVTRAMVDCHQLDGSARSLLGRVKTHLERQARKLDLAEREAEKRRIVELRKPTVLRERPADISEEEADRIAREYRARHAAPAAEAAS